MKRLLLLFLFLAGCAQQPAKTSDSLTTTAPAEKKSPGPGAFVPRGIDYTTAPEIIAFGSCARQDEPQPIWSAILASQPNLFLFMGDNIYATQPDQIVIPDQYRKLGQVPGYREAREKIPFLAIWDDGDLGTRDGGADAPTKESARKAFLDHWTYLKNSLPLNRDGLYHSKIMGGLVTGKRRKKINGPAVHVIVLDTRSFRSPLIKTPDPMDPEKQLIQPNQDPKATILGEEQWSWFEEQLKVPADVRLVVSSIQLIATEHAFEKWSNFPRERERFFRLLQKTQAKNVIVFSGDRHMGAIAKTDIKGWGPLYDITSSSLNRPASIAPETDPAYLSTPFIQENFGLAKLDLKKKTVKIELRGVTGDLLQETEIKLR